MNKLLLFIVCLLLGACSSTVKTNMITLKQPNPQQSDILVLKPNEEIPYPNKKIGSTKFGNSGFTVNCSLNYILNNARQIAQDYGADVVKITKHKRPNLWSVCHRLTVDYYITQKQIPNNNT